jgi:tRNA 2-selenouridine synthase
MLTTDTFIQNGQQMPILDVRSPGEYAQGHIPGAVSFPLFTDEERAKVGTRYKQVGKDSAFVLGLEFVGPKMAGFVKRALKLAPDRKISVHCWRGGQRSGSMAWLLKGAGFEVEVLKGGYKTYRHWVIEQTAAVAQQARFRVVGGPTGSGKTKIIHALRAMGEQVIDLEGLAHHKGSAFGFIGEQPQPSVEQFENLLWQAFSQLDPTRTIWLENESRSIGRVFIPHGFWEPMKAAPLFHVVIPNEARMEHLLADYVLEHTEDLRTAFQKIDSKLGGLRFKNAMEALDRGDFRTAAAIALEYYDKTYQHCLDVNQSPDIRRLEFEHGDPIRIAEALVGEG